MKFVYVLVSTSNDFYVEQAFLSILSLRKHNPDAYVELVTEEETKISLIGLRGRILETLNEMHVVYTPKELNKKCKSRYLKTSIRKIIKGDFLYIDCDTVIRANLQSLNNFDCDIAASYDRNDNGDTNEYMSEKFHKIGDIELKKYVFYNAGILLVKDTYKSKKFFDDWQAIWLDNFENFNIEIDQVSFLRANLNNDNLIKELPGVFNCQLSFSNSINYLMNSKILHYIADFKSLKEFPFENKELLSMVRKKGVTKEIEEILKNPVEEFLRSNIMLGKNETALYTSPLVIFARKISRDFPFINKIVSMGYKIFGYNV